MIWEHKGGEGRWAEYVNSETGESSIKEHQLKTVWQSCLPKDHYFEFTGNRELTCNKCGFITSIVIGPQKLVDGKIISIR